MPLFSYPRDLLYHQFLKSSTRNFDTPSEQSSAACSKISHPSSQPPPFAWDVQSACRSIIPALEFISENLAKHDLQIALLVSEQEPFVLPVWQLPQTSQCLLTRLVRKACIRYSVDLGWMTALASSEGKQEMSELFDTHTPDSYIIRRSLLQNEVVFTGEGLTLLSFDHIYTLKQLLWPLSNKELATSSRETCLSSCIHLLHRINNIHNGNKFSKGYMSRVYLDIPFQEALLDEVMTEYDTTFCTASIRRIDSDLSFTIFCDSPNAVNNQTKPAPSPPEPIPELKEDTAPAELVSPIASIDKQSLIPWKLDTGFSTHTAARPIELPNGVGHSINAIKAPKINRPIASVLRAQGAELAFITPFTAKAPSTVQRYAKSVPSPPSIPLPIPLSTPSLNARDSLPDTVFSSPTTQTSSLDHTISPSPLNIIKRASMEPTPKTLPSTPSPPPVPRRHPDHKKKEIVAREQETTLAVLEESISGEEAAEEADRLQWEEEERARVEEFEKTSRDIIESWTRGVEGLGIEEGEVAGAVEQEVVCSRCYDLVETGRRYTMCC
ncbi:uncharacterized protein KY384_003119 [Bacidia gigantensis]|uniref:uncharacterized protein n=1 Tax=Bacidia gigantensis TaxID=2732470 RepID=UPI001D04AD44|nr:uncharacterized protein KY384_003119 [Bacidia gigantensis]KAG8531490.1 hypothetical protein KY384_003119 [Bacidia gigantensis]